MTDRLYLRRVDPDRNMIRFYALAIEPNLFGEFSVVRAWGQRPDHMRAPPGESIGPVGASVDQKIHKPAWTEPRTTEGYLSTFCGTWRT